MGTITAEYAMARATPHRQSNRDDPRRDSRPRRNSVYAKHYTEDELRRIIAALDNDSDLSGAIEATQVILDRILTRLDTETDPDRWIQLARTWSDTTTRLATIMRTQRILSEQSADTLAGHIAAALDEVAAALGANL